MLKKLLKVKHRLKNYNIFKFFFQSIKLSSNCKASRITIKKRLT